MRLHPRRWPCLRRAALEQRRQERAYHRHAAWQHTQLILTALGNISIRWAGIGLILNHLIEWHIASTGHVPASGFPRAFTKKLDYIKEQIERDPYIHEDERTSLRELRLRLAKANEFRVELFHGYLWHVGTDLSGVSQSRRRLETSWSGLSLSEAQAIFWSSPGS